MAASRVGTTLHLAELPTACKAMVGLKASDESRKLLWQVEGLLGMSADDLAMLKEGDSEKQQQYQALLKKVQWQDYVVRLQTRTRSVTLLHHCCCSASSLAAVTRTRSVATGDRRSHGRPGAL